MKPANVEIEGREPYKFWRARYITAESLQVCLFCGCVVLEELWDDHVHWHDTLAVQAGVVLRQSLEQIEHELGGT